MIKLAPQKLLLLSFVCCVVLTGESFAQTTETAPKKVNFSYSQNPKTKPRTTVSETQNNQIADNQTVSKASETETVPKAVENKSDETEANQKFESRSIAQKTLAVAKKANIEAMPPTEVYKVGAGDVLFINLQNVPVKSSTYFTVLNDGTIDYPLVGEMISVGGLTTDEIEDLLREKIKLYENPQVSVKVREYASHSIKVFGLVDKPGEQFMQREAKPLFVVCAEAIVQPKANRVTIKRSNSTTETLNMNDPKYEDVLVFAGDIVEFSFSENQESAPRQPQFYYIGGNVNSLGQKDFYQGITLTQAIFASGGLRKSTSKKIIIRRKNAEGLLTPVEYNLKTINDGKVPDPLLQAGDTIEVGN